MSSARTNFQSPANDAGGHAPRRAVRSLTDGLVTLMLAVLLFRTFQVEGYMISTGSMAPTLLGYHKRVVCPTCRFPFACGEHVDSQDGVDVRGEPDDSPADGRQVYTICPNCGQRGIEISRVPRNQGDQLLVHKHGFLTRPPRRWEVVVFRNPYRASQAYVKRLVGLPGELLQIKSGDLYINGEIQRKPLDTLRAMRIPVYDHDFEPLADPGWQPRWITDDAGRGWTSRNRGFVFRPPDPSGNGLESFLESQTASESTTLAAENVPGRRTAGYRGDQSHAESRHEAAGAEPNEIAWVRYRHWLRAGGKHETAVELGPQPLPVDVPFGLSHIVRIEPDERRLACRGVLTDALRKELIAATTDPDFIRAADCLSEQSHLAPISDVYGYNRTSALYADSPVRDVCLQCELTVDDLAGEFHVEITDGRHTADFVIDCERGEYRLSIDGASTAVRTAAQQSNLLARPVILEVSMMDRQLQVALDGKLVFQPWNYAEADPDTMPHVFPVRFGARGLTCRVDSVKLFRDVYYTEGAGKNGIREPYQLKSGEYFVLGDNSPVSLDSRSWPDGAVPAKLLIGKPFVVHLPSRPGKIRFGTHESYIRLPDFSQIRLIR